jgi:phosphomevalonate kinase
METLINFYINLTKQRFKSFVNIIKIVDIKERLNEEKQLEDLREKVRTRRKDLDKITVQRTREGG